MAAAPAQAAPARRAPRSALTHWTVVSLLAGVAQLVYLQVAILRSFDPPIAQLFGPPALVVAALVAGLRRRWAPLLGALYWALALAANAPYVAYDLAHPEFRASFALSVVQSATALIGLAAGIGATVQNYQTPAAGRLAAPRWFFTGLVTLVGLCLGVLLVGALPRGSGVSAVALAELPALTTANFQFDQTALRATAGEAVALRLDNQDGSGHSFDIDELDVHVSMPPGEPALALFTPTTPGTYTFYCAVPGHRAAGMVGTLVVEP